MRWRPGGFGGTAQGQRVAPDDLRGFRLRRDRRLGSPKLRGSIAVHLDNVRARTPERSRPPRRAGRNGLAPGGYRRARRPLPNGQPSSTRMACLSPCMSSTGRWNGSRISRSPSLLSMRNRTP